MHVQDTLDDEIMHAESHGDDEWSESPRDPKILMSAQSAKLRALSGGGAGAARVRGVHGGGGVGWGRGGGVDAG